MVGKYISFNGEIFPAKTFNPGYDNRAMLYGDGLFETMRAHGIIVPFWELHYERLKKGMKTLKLQFDEAITKEKLRFEIERLLHREKFYVAASVRLTVYRRPGGKYAPETDFADFLIQCSPLESTGFQFNTNGLLLGRYAETPKPISMISRYKTLNALPSVLAARWAKHNNFDDVVIFNTNGFVCETSSSNIFAIKDNTIVTPSLQAGCVDGIMRAITMKLATKHGLELIETQTLTLEVLKKADELFITNALRGIRSVIGVERARYYAVKTAELSKMLNEIYDKTVLKMG